MMVAVTFDKENVLIANINCIFCYEISFTQILHLTFKHYSLDVSESFTEQQTEYRWRRCQLELCNIINRHDYFLLPIINKKYLIRMHDYVF